MDRPFVSLITVNFNGREHLDVLLRSVFAQTYPPDRLEVIVVDNGSSDGSVDFVRAEYPQAHVVPNETNVGFAAANNQGSEIAEGQYLALVNNDMRLEPDWVDRMVSRLECAPPDVVCVGSLILDWEGSRVDFGGSTLAFNGIGFQTNANAPAESPPERFPEEMLFACGGALMVHREVYLEVGGFDADYFAYLEDVDFGWRLWVLGYRVMFCPEAVVYHRHNATSSQFDEHRKMVLIERNAFYSMIKNYDDVSLKTVLGPALLLAFKRLGIASGISRKEFEFTPLGRPSSAMSAGERSENDESYRHAFLRVWHEQGLAAALRKALVKGRSLAMQRARRQRRRTVVTSRMGEAERTIHRSAYATVVAIEDVIDHLPGLLAKRERVQARRRRSDAEVLRVFRTPFKTPAQPPKRREAYESAYGIIVDALAVRQYVASLASTTEAGTDGEAQPSEALP
jgi:GT2 family glycosyltransferase